MITRHETRKLNKENLTLVYRRCIYRKSSQGLSVCICVTVLLVLRMSGVVYRIQFQLRCICALNVCMYVHNNYIETCVHRHIHLAFKRVL